MNNFFESDLCTLLKNHFGDDFDFYWKSEDGGFQCRIEVFNQLEDEE